MCGTFIECTLQPRVNNSTFERVEEVLPFFKNIIPSVVQIVVERWVCEKDWFKILFHVIINLVTLTLVPPDDG
jgi:hypothetical protein